MEDWLMCPFTGRRCYQDGCMCWHESDEDCVLVMAAAEYVQGRRDEDGK